ncbi:MAG: PLP-dependent aminotransferase family protein [Acidimicrobiia bacterium]|nr:PLP-dependent aminotransferase family protein [Acidimicrobiia bacterium]
MTNDEFIDAISPWLSPTNGPIRAHLALAIRQAIGTGHLPAGTRLPPERVLALALHVSRPTISAVVDDLRASGLVDSRQGSGSWVTTGHTPSRPSIPFVERLQTKGSIDLAAATAPDASLLPPMRVENADLLGAEPANGLTLLGLEPLREEIARRHQLAFSSTPAVSPDQVVITSGAHQALALVVASLAPRGSTILVEETTYGGAIDMIHANGCVPVGVPRDDSGVDPDALASLLTTHRPALTILVSSVHSPTGTVSPPERNHEVAAVLARSDSQVVLDETYSDLEFMPTRRVLAEELGSVAIRIGSLSKSLWTGLRTGWIIAPPSVCTSIGRQRWQQFDLGPSIPAQLFALQALAHFDDVVEVRRAQLSERSQWFARALAIQFPEWSLSRVDGGLAVWAKLPVDGAEFAANAARRGVAVLPGSACRADGSATPHIRLCFDRPIDVLESAIDRLS